MLDQKKAGVFERHNMRLFVDFKSDARHLLKQGYNNHGNINHNYQFPVKLQY